MSYPDDASTTQIRLGPGMPVGHINFIAQGNPGEPAKFCVVCFLSVISTLHDIYSSTGPQRIPGW
jgi:hypothetical protein